ncbi:MAG: 16S rRNA (guanine(527)-N(7))-methyltransferase RsmG [Fusobacterium sp.]|nr:16S rRNA (guanine(527)-N(7))-methyltransferase RsmG [Fusobacterium sp.]
MNNKQNYEHYMARFLEENAKINLISKNEEKFLWEKHVYDSLSLELFFDKFGVEPAGKTLLDIGTGGGFPAVPVAIKYPMLKVTALDSIRKKLTAIENISRDMGVSNLETHCERAENFTEKYDFITSRAVATLDKISAYALPLLKKGGYFIAYKSKKVQEEIDGANPVLKRLGGEIIDIIEYRLPLEEIYERNLVIIKKK